MEGLVYLSGESPQFARAEVLAALRSMGIEGVDVRGHDRIALLDGGLPTGLARRLGMCHFAGYLEGTCTVGIEPILGLVRSVLDRPDPSLSVAPLVRMGRTSHPFRPRDLFHAIEETMRKKGRKVMLKHPDIRVFCVVSGKAYVGTVLQTSERSDLLKRRGSSLPFSRPVMMDPRLARAMVNLLGLPPGASLLDPFMGPGGLLMEAARMGYDCTGVEIDPKVQEGAMTNIRSEGLEARAIALLGDSTKIDAKDDVLSKAPFDGLLTDPPFGRSSSSSGRRPSDLVPEVFEKVCPLLKDGAPVVMDSPDMDQFSALKDYGLVEVHGLRQHRSLTRYIGVLKKK